MSQEEIKIRDNRMLITISLIVLLLLITMPVHRRLNRPDMRQQLQRIARKWKGLSYCDFVLRACYEMNPDYTNDPDLNFSMPESIGGYISPRPVRYRDQDIRTYIDQWGRPDLYAVNWAKRQRTFWNDQIEHRNRLIYVIAVQVREVKPKTKRRPEQVRIVIHDYVRPLRGTEFVRQLDRHLVDGIEGLEETRETIQPCTNTRLVDMAIEERLRWQENQARGWR